MSLEQNPNCFNCRNYLRFSPAEKAVIEEMLQRNQYTRPVWGACTARNGDAQLVRRYITAPVSGCALWRAGQFRELLDCRCPQCKSGDLAIVRPSREQQTYTLVGCTRYPECRFMTRFVPLVSQCRYCHVPLVLETGDLIMCRCPNCHRGVAVPLMFKSWPQLAPASRTCVHGSVLTECTLCQASIRARVSLIVMEMPAVLSYWRTVERVHHFKLSSHPDDIPFRDTLYDIEWSSEAEELEDLWSELDEIAANYARSEEEGWYYPD
jgi:ssDNA-binding Zn-finger/Zn-ribbon topoisomerase 1